MKLLCSIFLTTVIWTVLLTAHPEVVDAFRQVAEAPERIELAMEAVR